MAFVEIFDADGNTIVNEDGSPGSSMEQLAQAMADAGAAPSQDITGSFRVCLRGNQWRSLNKSYGSDWPDWKQYLGVADAPAWNWDHRGFPVKAGRTIKSLTVLGYASSSSVSEMQYHWTFRTGDWNNGLDSRGETEFTDVFVGTMDVSTPGADQSRHVALANFTAPSDGILMPCFRAESASNRYFYGDFILEVQP